jgi:hypothetical protein
MELKTHHNQSSTNEKQRKKILKSARERQHNAYKGMIQMTIDFSSETNAG